MYLAELATRQLYYYAWLNNVFILGHVDILEWLFQHSLASGLERDDFDTTPVHDAAEEGQIDCLKVFHKYKVDLCTKDTDGFTPRLKEWLEITVYRHDHMWDAHPVQLYTHWLSAQHTSGVLCPWFIRGGHSWTMWKNLHTLMQSNYKCCLISWSRLMKSVKVSQQMGIYHCFFRVLLCKKLQSFAPLNSRVRDTIPGLLANNKPLSCVHLLSGSPCLSNPLLVQMHVYRES